MKYWEIIADKLSENGWTWGYYTAVTSDGWRSAVDTPFCNLFLAAHRRKRSKRCIVLQSLSLALEVEPAEH
jgi:hypothetical protein